MNTDNAENNAAACT